MDEWREDTEVLLLWTMRGYGRKLTRPASYSGQLRWTRMRVTQIMPNSLFVRALYVRIFLQSLNFLGGGAAALLYTAKEYSTVLSRKGVQH